MRKRTKVNYQKRFQCEHMTKKKRSTQIVTHSHTLTQEKNPSEGETLNREKGKEEMLVFF